MKNALLALLIAASLALAGLYAWQRTKTHEAQATVGNLSQNLNELQAQTEEKEKQAATLQSRLENTQVKAIAKADEVAQLQQVLTNQVAANSNSSNPLGEMFKSPEMKELIKTQQKTFMGGMIDKNYAALFAGLKLTPEQSTTLKDLLMKKSLVGADMGLSMLGGDTDAAKRKELMQQAKEETDGIDQQIKQFLGDANYEQFQAYEKTVPERMTLGMFKDQLASGPSALAPDQEAQLIQAMADERQKFKFTTDFSDKSKFEGDFASFFTEEKINQFQTETEQLNKLYLQRAQSILSPDQLGSFDKFLSGQRAVQAVGMKMAIKMFGAKPAGQ